MIKEYNCHICDCLGRTRSDQIHEILRIVMCFAEFAHFFVLNTVFFPFGKSSCVKVVLIVSYELFETCLGDIQQMDFNFSRRNGGSASFHDVLFATSGSL